MVDAKFSMGAVSCWLVFVCLLVSLHNGVSQRENPRSSLHRKGDLTEGNRVRRDTYITAAMAAMESSDCSDCICTATDMMSQSACCVEDLWSFAMSHCGKDGRDGRDGRDAEKGQKGEDGQQGPIGPTGPRGADTTNPSTSGAVYIRWGRTTCPATSEIIYEGLAGGEWYNNQGGGSNYLCLPLTPEFDEINSGADNSRGYVYSAEYEIGGFPPFASKYNHDVPCAVCRAGNRGSIVTIPAKMTCPSGWTKEYYGYLMTEYHNYYRRDFACVDRNPESVPGGNGNENGALFHPVEFRCDLGNLPCAMYPQGHELSCVVCTK